jgi:uroporphyrin-III C-methyltransferase
VVVHDRLVSPEVLALARPEARRIPVGKARNHHSVPQSRIHEILVREARAGQTVVRLKGGDPFVFGRGGEELEALEAAAIPVQVVPGITAALGCAAEARIPLTRRGLAHQCVWVTGHRCQGEAEPDWAQLARPGQTLVIYMGLHALEELCARLTAHGMPADTPAALVQDGTTPRSRTLRGTLGTLAGLARAARIEPPAVLIVGAVAGLGRNRDGTTEPSAPAGGESDDLGGQRGAIGSVITCCAAGSGAPSRD